GGSRRSSFFNSASIIRSLRREGGQADPCRPARHASPNAHARQKGKFLADALALSIVRQTSSPVAAKFSVLSGDDGRRRRAGARRKTEARAGLPFVPSPG